MTLMLKVKSPMVTILRVGRTAGLSLADDYLAAANVMYPAIPAR